MISIKAYYKRVIHILQIKIIRDKNNIIIDFLILINLIIHIP